ERQDRKGFDDATWIGINVGRKKNAEPRWLLPMLCKAGGLGRDDIGAIRINPADTHVELKPDAAKRLFEVIGNDGMLEKGLRAFALDGPPPAQPPRQDYAPSRERTPGKPPRKPHLNKKPKSAAAAPEKAFDPLTDYIQDDRPAGKPRKDKPHAHGKGKPTGGDKTYKRPKPQGGKKPFKKGPKKPRD
ncbi:MAG TPA: ATP-dependent RNA helicase, partial [Hyphomonas sp.]|nr:ATP-dependent RNA helicase [Hyphomonas sp.]